MLVMTTAVIPSHACAAAATPAAVTLWVAPGLLVQHQDVALVIDAAPEGPSAVEETREHEVGEVGSDHKQEVMVRAKHAGMPISGRQPPDWKISNKVDNQPPGRSHASLQESPLVRFVAPERAQRGVPIRSAQVGSCRDANLDWAVRPRACTSNQPVRVLRYSERFGATQLLQHPPAHRRDPPAAPGHVSQPLQHLGLLQQEGGHVRGVEVHS